MAVINDVGDTKDIHPKNKQDVGKRLAQWALAKTYKKDVAACGPLYKGMKKNDGKIVVEFATIDDLERIVKAMSPAAAIRARTVSPVEYVQALFHVIDRIESRVEAWVTIDRESGRIYVYELIPQGEIDEETAKKRQRQAGEPIAAQPIDGKRVEPGMPLDEWRPLLLWHMTRDEFLVRFLREQKMGLR